MSDIVIIGGGIVGVSSAYYLAKRGISVTLVEKGRIGAEQSSRNWGAVRQQGRDPAELPLMQACSREIWGNLEAELEASLDWRREGQMRIAYDLQMLKSFEDFMPIARAHGLDTEILTPDQIADTLPYYDSREALGAMFTPSDGCANPEKVAPAFTAAAKRLGATINENCAAFNIEKQGGKVYGVATERGLIKASQVLVAAGAWSSRILDPLGVRHPSLWVRASVAKTQPIKLNLRKLVVWGKCAHRQRLDNRVIIAVAEDGFHDICFDSFRFGARYIPLARKHWHKLKFTFSQTSREALAGEYKDFARHRILNPKPDVTGLRQAAQLFRQEYPDAPELHFENSWAGQIDFMPDELPVVSADTAIPGLAIAAGFSGHGFGLAPVIGRSMAELLTLGRCCFNLEPFCSRRWE